MSNIMNILSRLNDDLNYNYQDDNIDRESIKMLYDLLVKLGKRGIDNILQTYANVDQPALLHTLQMYRTLLENPELVMKNNNSNSNLNSLAPNSFPDRMLPALAYPSTAKAAKNHKLIEMVYAAIYSFP